MKTLFQTGFAAQRRFWMGVSAINPSALYKKMDLYAKVQAWLASTTNARDILGTDADSFQAMNTEIRGLYDDVVTIAQKADANQDLSDDEVTKANTFVRDAENLWAIIQAHPQLAQTPPITKPPSDIIPKPATTAPSATSPTNPAQANTSVASKPPAAAAPAAAAPNYTPLLIGGGIVGALLLVIVATK